MIFIIGVRTILEKRRAVIEHELATRKELRENIIAILECKEVNNWNSITRLPRTTHAKQMDRLPIDKLPNPCTSLLSISYLIHLLASGCLAFVRDVTRPG